jgi:ABC-type nitrate/sulfonate/bicarbonate transport system ATPase subunit
LFEAPFRPAAIKSAIAAVFAFTAGEFVSLVGPSGCGKSTLFNIVSGLLNPDQGAVLLDGRMIDRPIVDRARRWLAAPG